MSKRRFVLLNEDAILATIDNSNNPMEGVRIIVGGIKDLRAERDALAKRVAELEAKVAYAVCALRQLDDLLPAAQSSGTIARCAVIHLTEAKP